jgi:hypothetical protein
MDDEAEIWGHFEDINVISPKSVLPDEVELVEA